MEPTTTAAAVRLRPGRAEDAPELGRIIFEAFGAIAERHGYPSDFPSIEMAVRVASMLLDNPRIYSVVAEHDGRTVGSNFLAEGSTIAGIGPISVDPALQDSGVGGLMMRDVMERARSRGLPGVRLVQTAYHIRSLSLYMKLGFDAREELVVLQGPPIGVRVPAFDVRSARAEDLDEINAVCVAVHGHDRAADVADGLDRGALEVVERAGRIAGYTTGVGYFSHSVATTNDGLKALIGSAGRFGGLGFLLPARNGEIFRWALGHGLQVVQVATLMSTGLYNEPQGAYLPSILY